MVEPGDTFPHVRHEADYVRQANQPTAERLKGAELIDPYDQHTVWAQASLERPVESLDRRAVTLPPSMSKFVGDAEGLQSILYDAWAMNERFAGEVQVEAYVQANGTVEQREIIDRSLAWAGGYVARRLSRPTPRDRGCQYRRFLRLWHELVPFVDEIGMESLAGGECELTSAMGQYLGPMCDFIAWSFFEGTWMTDVDWSETDARPRIRERPDVDIETRVHCMHAFGVYRWKKARVFDLLLREMATALAASGATRSGDDDDDAAIARMADEIGEMRPLLVRNFPRSKAVVKLPGGWVALFGWDTLDQIGTLVVARTERELLDASARGMATFTLSIGADGMLRCDVCPWRSVASYEHPLAFPPMAIGRVVLEAVHARLFGFYDRMDVRAILARWKTHGERPDAARPPTIAEEVHHESGSTSTGGAGTPADEVEVIAASIALGSGIVEEGRQAGRVRSSLRLTTLRAVLERSFACEARTAKGSEVVFYRPGHRHAIVGRHSNNPLVSAVAIQRVLRSLGISVAEWVRATQ